MKYLTLILVLLLTWAHIAPQIHSYYGARQIATQVDCSVGYTFYLMELEFDFTIACPEADRDRIINLLDNI